MICVAVRELLAELAVGVLTSGERDEVERHLRWCAGCRKEAAELGQAAAIVAAMVAVGSLGWGAVMAWRAERFEERAAQAQQDQLDAVARFQKAISQIIPGQPVAEGEMKLGQLQPGPESLGGGFVLQLVSPTRIDFTMVIVNGLDPAATDRLPYRVQLFNAAGEMLKAGRIDELDADGGAETFHEFAHADLIGFTSVRVVDRTGEVVLDGDVER